MTTLSAREPFWRTVRAFDPPRSTGFALLRMRWEIWLVLAVTVGKSALYSVLSFIRALQRSLQENQAISSQQTQLNPARDTRSAVGRAYQLSTSSSHSRSSHSSSICSGSRARTRSGGSASISAASAATSGSASR